MASCRVKQKRVLTEHFKQRAVKRFTSNSCMKPTETWKFLVIIIIGKHVLARLFSSTTSDFRTVERTSATISGVGDPIFRVLRMFKSQLRCIRFLKREEFNFAVRSAVAKFGLGFHTNAYSVLVERHMRCAACGCSYFEKECKT